MRLALTFIASLAAASPALAGATFLINPVLKEGDAVPGVGTVTTIDNLAVNNSGTWVVEADTDFADTDQDAVVVRSGVLHLREGQALAAPAGATLDSFDSITLNNSGQGGHNFFLANTGGTTNDSGVFLDAGLVFQEGYVSASPGFSPGTPYIGFFDTKINDSNQIMVVASIDDPAIASTVDRALVIVQLGPGGSLVSETVIAKEGDVLPGQTEAVADFGTGPHASAFNDAGEILYFADLTGLTTTDGAVYRNLTLLAQEGSPSSIPGRNYETLSSRGLDLADSGDWAMKANLDGTTTDDEVLVKNGVVFRREGDSLPATGGNVFTGFGATAGPIQIDNFGNVVWFGDWDNPDLDKDTALFWNDLVIVGEGEQLGALVVDEISNGDDAFQMSDDGRWIACEVTFVGGISAVLLIEVIDQPVPVQVTDFAATQVGDRVRLEWRLADPESELSAVQVQRAVAAEGPWQDLAGARLDPASVMHFEDTTAEAGRDAWYRLTLVGHDGSRTATGPVEVATALARTSLTAAFESPQDGAVRVRYVVANAGEAVELRVHDVRGRLLWSHRDVGGSHVREARWDRRDGSGVRAARGVYWVQLHSGDARATRKVVLASR